MLVFDLEADGLLDELTVIHTINVIDRTSGARLRFNGGVYADGSPAPRHGSIEDGVRLLMDAECVGGHNIIGYDLLALAKVYPWFVAPQRVRDSLVEARVVWSDLKDIDFGAIKRNLRPPEFAGMVGLHSLKAWGIRLGVHKGDFEGPWDKFTQTMDAYAIQDPEVNLTLFEKIDSKGYSAAALELENEVQKVVVAMERHGVLFDVPAAEKLLAVLTAKRAELEDKLRVTIAPWWEPVREKGQHKVLTPARDHRTHGYVAGCPLTKVVLQTFNPGSRDHIANRMKALFGWVPQEFTETGKPKVDETTLAGLDYPEAKLLVEYLTVEKRLGQLAEGNQAWLKWVKSDGRIHGRINPMGTISHRAAHSNPNLGQVPASKSPYGHECRALFIVAKGRKQVGVDAEGVQLRVLGHYMARFDGGAFAQALAHGVKEEGTDAHTLNQRAMKLNLRDSAKTWIYAFLLGAGAWKLGSIVYDDFTEAQREAFNAKHPPGEARDKAFVSLGNRSKRRIEDGIPALKAVQDLFKSRAPRGYILSLDGRRVVVRSAHTALAMGLQAGEAIICKKAMVLFHQRARERGWVWGVDYAQTLWVHDEYQFEVYRPEIADELGAMAAQCIADVGPMLGVLCDLAGKAEVGDNWNDTH